MPFHLRSNNPLIRMVTAAVVALSWYAVVGTVMVCGIVFFGHFDTEAFLRSTEPKDDLSITGFEHALVVAITIGFPTLFKHLFKSFTRYFNRKLNKKLEWDDTYIP